MFASAASGPNGITAQAASAGMMVMIGPRKKRPRLAAVGTMISLKISLTRVGDRLQQAERADAVRARADLAPADRLALPERQVGDRAHQRHDERDDLDDGPDDRPGAAEHADAVALKASKLTSELVSCDRPRRARSRRRLDAARRAAAPNIGAERGGERMAGGDADHAGRERRLDARRQHDRCLALTDAHDAAVDDAELGRELARHADDGRARVGGELQRGRAADERVGGVDRHVGDALEAARRPRRSAMRRRLRPACWRPAPTSRSVATSPSASSRTSSDVSSREARQAEQVAQHAQHLPGRPRVAERLDDAVEALHAAFGVDEGARRFGERRDRQQHVGDVVEPA